MKSILSVLSTFLAFVAGCQSSAVPPPASNPPVVPAKSMNSSPAIWVAVDDPGEFKSPQELFQIATQRVIPNLKKLPGVGDVQILGSLSQLAIVDDIPSVIIKLRLLPEVSHNEFQPAFMQMESLPVAVNTVLDEASDGWLTVELQLPTDTDFDRTRLAVANATELVNDIETVDFTITYFDAHQSNHATIIVKQTSNRPLAEEVRQALDALSEEKCVVSVN